MSADNHTLREKREKAEKQGLLMHFNYNIKNLPNQKKKKKKEERKKEGKIVSKGLEVLKCRGKEKIAQCKRS